MRKIEAPLRGRMICALRRGDAHLPIARRSTFKADLARQRMRVRCEMEIRAAVVLRLRVKVPVFQVKTGGDAHRGSRLGSIEQSHGKNGRVPVLKHVRDYLNSCDLAVPGNRCKLP